MNVLGMFAPVTIQDMWLLPGIPPMRLCNPRRSAVAGVRDPGAEDEVAGRLAARPPHSSARTLARLDIRC